MCNDYLVAKFEEHSNRVDVYEFYVTFSLLVYHRKIVSHDLHFIVRSKS